MKTLSTTILLLATLLLTSFTINLGTAEINKDLKPRWVSIQEAYRLVKQQPRNVVVDVYTDWCGWCKKMDKSTFQHPSVAKYMNDKYYAVKLDAEMKQTINIDGERYKYVKQGRSGVHEIALLLLDSRMSFPTTVMLDKNFNRLSVIPGYLDAKEMDKVLRYFGDGHHDKGITWPAFERQFQSKVRASKTKKARRRTF